MRSLILSLMLCMLVSCSSEPEAVRLKEGAWSGGLTPMNHPDMTTPLTFGVGYDGARPDITIGGPGGMSISTRNAAIDGDTLRFVFNEPEQNVLLTCALGYEAGIDGRISYAGRCADADGKWAAVTMTEPHE